jgi:hypothetical protein
MTEHRPRHCALRPSRNTARRSRSRWVFARSQRVTRLVAAVVNTLLGSGWGRATIRSAIRAAKVLPGASRIRANANVSDTDGRRRIGGVGTNMLFENDRVRVWELRLAPGTRTDLHHHQLDYLIVQIAGDRVGAEVQPDSPDSVGLAGTRFITPVRPGLVVSVPRGGLETAFNPGRQPYHEVLIELKD